jgi:hypothetical protein
MTTRPRARPHVLAATLALAIAGCTMASTTFGFAFPEQGGNIGALPVVLTDHTAMVVDVDAAPDNFEPLIETGIAPFPGNPNAVVVHWIGGACDSGIRMTLTGAPGMTLAVETTRKDGPCILIGIGRAVLIQFGRPIDMSQIGVRFD